MPESMTVELLFHVFQFGATLMFVSALLMMSDRITRFYYYAFAVLGVGLLVSLVYTQLNGFPEDVVGQYQSLLPLFVLTSLLFWRALQTDSRFTLGRLFLILASFSMLLFRLILPTIPAGLISDFIYFLEYLTFTVHADRPVVVRTGVCQCLPSKTCCLKKPSRSRILSSS
jgi:hypothetical protein